MDEFDIIKTYFAPFAAGGAVGFEDDVAALDYPEGARLIVTSDAIVEGVHFLSDDPLDLVAKKLLRANVSDVIAKGARPLSASLTLIWPKARPVEELALFAGGLSADLQAWGIALLGGDTTSTPGPLCLSLTLNGVAYGGGPVRRSGAQPGDDVWLSGPIGDSGLGLRLLRGEIAEISRQHSEALIARYRTPRPPSVAFAELVAKYASASIDVSDGLIADASHLAQVSSIQVDLDCGNIPLSEAAVAWNAGEDDAAFWRGVLTFGDDYQTLFTAPVDVCADVEAYADQLGLRLFRIGTCRQGSGVAATLKGAPLSGLEKSGWRHF